MSKIEFIIEEDKSNETEESVSDTQEPMQETSNKIKPHNTDPHQQQLSSSNVHESYISSENDAAELDETEIKSKLKARLSKWLWAARFYKTSALAIEAIENGKVLYNKKHVNPSTEIEVGSTITIRKSDEVYLLINVKGLSTRRKNEDGSSELCEVTEITIPRFPNNSKPSHNHYRRKRNNPFTKNDMPPHSPYGSNNQNSNHLNKRFPNNKQHGLQSPISRRNNNNYESYGNSERSYQKNKYSSEQNYHQPRKSYSDYDSRPSYKKDYENYSEYEPRRYFSGQNHSQPQITKKKSSTRFLRGRRNQLKDFESEDVNNKEEIEVFED